MYPYTSDYCLELLHCSLSATQYPEVRQPVLLSLVTSLIMTRLDYGSAVLAGLRSHLLNRLQFVLNAATHLVCRTRKYDHVTHLLRDLHWLRVPERIQFRLAVLAFCCHNHKAPSYLADKLQWTDEADNNNNNNNNNYYYYYYYYWLSGYNNSRSYNLISYLIEGL